MFHDYKILSPFYSYLLAINILLVLWFVFVLFQRKKKLQNLIEGSSLSNLLFLEKRTYLRYVLLACVWCFASIAMMQPVKIQKQNSTAQINSDVVEEKWVDNLDKEKVLIKRRACEVIFVIDASASMEVADTRQKKTRLEVAKEIVDEMINHMDGQNVALYTFTSQLTQVVPATLDYFFAKTLLKDIEINYGDMAGTDLIEALDHLSRKHFLNFPQKQKVVILLTDGGDTYLDTLSKQERMAQMQIMIDKIKKSEGQNIRLFTVGLGSVEKNIIPNIEYEGHPVLSALDVDLLIQLSQECRGQFYFANDHSSLLIAENILKIVQAENSVLEEEATPRKKMERLLEDQNQTNLLTKDYYQIPLTLAIFLLSLEILLPNLPMRKKVKS